MNDPPKSPWNSLEVTKLILGLLTPVLLALVGYQINQSFRAADDARAEASRDAQRAQKENDELRQAIQTREIAIASYSRLIYGRRVRSELLASSLNRHAKAPTAESLKEVLERKRLYDEAYVDWNANLRANLLLVRSIVDPTSYTSFESLVEFRLSRNFAVLDACLTEAYDSAIRLKDPRPMMVACEAPKLLQRALDCGYAVVDELFKMSSSQSSVRISASIVEQHCPAE